MFFRRAATNFLRRVRIPLQIVSSSGGRTTNPLPLPLSGKTMFSYQDGGRGYTGSSKTDSHLWIVMFTQAAILGGINANLALAEDVSIQSNSENDVEGVDEYGLRKIEDGSVISNIHTSKWRIFTDTGMDYFMQGKHEQAERLFISALQEAKEGFGEREAHVASACNNLAELYRVKKEFDKAEPLYLEAIHILEESFGPEDIRVGAAFHNLGQFYLVQRKLEEAQNCYERALKIKRRVLGPGHSDYADTMYHLGTVLYLQGKEQDAEVLIQDSIRILEEGGQGESITCIKRMRYLSQIYLRANRPEEAVNVQRKILHVMEISKGWNSLETVIAAEGLALTLQATGSLREAQELLERCLDARKSLLRQDHIQIGANMLHIARVRMLNASRLRKMHESEGNSEFDRAKELLDTSTRIARQALNKSMTQKVGRRSHEAPGATTRDGRAVLVILLQSLEALGQLEITKQESQERTEVDLGHAETALFKCILTYKEFQGSIIDSPEAKAEYLSCLQQLSSLINDAGAIDTRRSSKTNPQELKEEIKRIEVELSSIRKSKR